MEDLLVELGKYPVRNAAIQAAQASAELKWALVVVWMDHGAVQAGTMLIRKAHRHEV
ncbi:MAG: hypothetical protein RDU20_22415 [Desulfomonilaceae bacterium]|nr:hypothetical protein [Desulfomonilaceae bacterium]